MSLQIEAATVIRTRVSVRAVRVGSVHTPVIFKPGQYESGTQACIR